MIKLMEKSFFHDEDAKRALAEFVLKTERFSMGEQCFAFEQGFAEWQSRNHCVFVSSGSTANLILIQALLNMGRLQKGDAVGFSAVTWPTNVMPLIQLGLKPVPIDCELETLNVSSSQLLSVVESQQIKAFFITNALGFASDLDEIARICKEKNIILLEDNCESLGSVLNGVKLGNFGLASTFSTFIGHHMSTIEGGMICTDDKELHDHLVMCRAHGWDRNLSKETQTSMRKEVGVGNFSAMYTFYELSYNVRPTEIQGFLGNFNLKFLDEIIDKRQKNFEVLHKAASHTQAVQLNVGHMDTISNFAMPLLFKDAEQFEYYKKLFIDNGIEIRPIIAGNMLLQPFYNKHVDESAVLVNANIIHSQGFYFGNRPDLTQKNLDLISNLLKSENGTV